MSESIKVSGAIAKDIQELSQLRKELAELKKRETALKDNILGALGESKIATFRSIAIAKLRERNLVSFDRNGLKAKYPKIYAEFAKPSVSQVLEII